MSLPTRKIGKDDVPYPGLGTMGMSGWYAGFGDTERNIATLKAAWEKGCRFWDTADIYGDKRMWENEELISQVMKECNIPRKDIFLATKFGNWQREDGSRVIVGTPEYVKEACDRSLKALGTDYIDLYYQHRVDKNTPIEDTMQAMKELQSAGKIRYIGLSECSAATLRRACAVVKVDALQVEYSLWETSPETNGLFDACKELGVAFVAYSPLGRGLISGSVRSRKDLTPDDNRWKHPRFSEENFPKNVELVEELAKLAAAKGVTSAQLAIAWVHAQWDGILAIPGTTRIERLEENLDSLKVHFTPEELAEIRKILDSFPRAGTRYPEAMMRDVHI
ncbi:Aldo/keto reductase [Dacryopinax primogenitus]|uniref:Aldo/keto reductase n=1 Tax=Dacryopinax primogenitus (strain DJM 731) TaxID=1858805 RepID=M5G0T2_DACPD|nr:Aldo/keto reductase [Dacryopinax primogenitus]EJU03861.1 Aldo/keto reductase [Dacryopinax primogenitus]